MTRHIRSSVTAHLAAAALLALAQASAGASSWNQPAGDTNTVSVTVNYAGSGTVDANHRLWIWLFPSPEIGPASMPIAEMPLEQNGATATFAGISAGEVWITVAYDEKGGFTGSAPPPTGSPVAIYADEQGKPKGVAPGRLVTVTFDGSMRMP
jgi:hypothetical protein